MKINKKKKKRQKKKLKKKEQRNIFVSLRKFFLKLVEFLQKQGASHNLWSAIVDETQEDENDTKNLKIFILQLEQWGSPVSQHPDQLLCASEFQNFEKQYFSHLELNN